MKPLFLLSALLLSPAFSHSALASCLDNFNDRLTQAPEFYQKQQLLLSQGENDMECLFKEASAKIDASFFLDESHIQHNQVQKFLAVSSFSVGRKYEKHFFRLTKEPSGADIYGYTVLPDAKINKTSPGLFKLVETKNADGKSSSVSIDYRLNFENTFKLTSNTTQMKKIDGFQMASIKNSRGNLLFHDLVDTFHSINDEIAVGKAERVVPGKKNKFFCYFLILKKE
mgnify:CR=1 FL=1